MCTDHEHQGLIEDAAMTRRRFVTALGSVAAGTLAAPALAASGASRAVKSHDVLVPMAEGTTADAVLFHPESEGKHSNRWPAVLVWPDILGLRPVFREMGQRLAAEGYTVLVPNPFYRSQRAPVVDGSFDFGNPEHRARVFALRGAMTDAGIDADAAAYLKFLDAQPQTDTHRPAGVQGYCMGGPLSFRTAAAVHDRIAAVASFHGGGLVTREPASPHLLIPKTRAEYLVAVARNDDAREPDAKETLKAAFAAASRPATVEVYAADHGWCVFGSQSYVEAEAERAWAELLKLYARNLKA